MNKGLLILDQSDKQNLYVRYAPALVERDESSQRGQLLGGLWPSAEETLLAKSGHPAGYRIPMVCLGGAQYAWQQWCVDGASPTVICTEIAGITVTAQQTDDYLLAVVSLTDEGLVALSLVDQSHLAYQALLSVMQSQNKPHLLRIWNFVPRINGLDAGIERYRLFNQGREEALRTMGYTLRDGAPAACALGTQTGGLGVVVLAGIHPAVAIENPRQVSAYNYPRQYGAHAPIFSRAVWLPLDSGEHLLLISGTASIVGHQTLHAGDVLAQLKESVRNIEALLYSANQRAGADLWHLDELKGRVYLRHATDYDQVRDHLLTLGMTQFCFVVADICRSDLLVEIEAEGQCVMGSAGLATAQL
jgi:enamine deaminase RidA (YjgF/YER057c/UK114 family)